MIPIKSILTILAVVSLCMANISGIVTDTGTTPISGAVVKLENAGWTATTDADGSFTLSANTGIFPGYNKLLPNGLSAKIAGNLLTVTIAERSAVEVTTFDLNGKTLSTVRKTLDAGNHSIALSQRGTGIYLYKVKSGNRAFVLKGNSIGKVSSGSALSSQDFPSNPIAIQAKATVAIKDVIAATKTGYLNYRCVQYNSDTSEVIKMIASAGNLMDTDGNVYQTVRIGNQVWMTENLRVTKYNDGTGITNKTDKVAWAACSSSHASAYCFYNNTTNADSIKKYGALYNWYVVSPTNPKKIAPAGWHVPSDSEWTILKNYLVLNGYNWDEMYELGQDNKIGKSMAAMTDWYGNLATGTIGCNLTKNNRSGFSALPGGRRYNDGNFEDHIYFGFWWSSTVVDEIAWNRNLICSNSYITRGWGYHNQSLGFSVRLVRDH